LDGYSETLANSKQAWSADLHLAIKKSPISSVLLFFRY